MFPFYPPRPLHGRPITKKNVFEFIERMQKTHVVQPKLGGDRAIMLVKDGVVQVSNRHYSLYKHTVNKARWSGMPDGTLLDGEVWKKEFYPFEVVQYGTENLSGRGMVEARVAKAKEVSAQVNLPFLFDVPTKDTKGFIDMNGTNEWEGIVCKHKFASYRPLASAGQETPNWIKLKWEEPK